MLVGNLATHIDLDNSNQAPFTLAHGWANFLGTDPLGRSMLARLIVACRTTLSVAIPAVVISAVVGSAIGMWAGFYRGWRETVAMRDRRRHHELPVAAAGRRRALRVLAQRREHRCWCWRSPASRCTCARPAPSPPSCRAGCSSTPHARSAPAPARSSAATCCPIVLPTLLTVATLDFCYVMLAESSLSFLGIGIQPPDVSWGLMVVAGPHLPAHRVVAVVLPRPGHRHHHGVGHDPRRVGPHRHRSRSAVAPDRPAEAAVPLHQDHEGALMRRRMTAAVGHKPTSTTPTPTRARRRGPDRRHPHHHRHRARRQRRVASPPAAAKPWRCSANPAAASR